MEERLARECEQRARGLELARIEAQFARVGAELQLFLERADTRAQGGTLVVLGQDIGRALASWRWNGIHGALG